MKIEILTDGCGNTTEIKINDEKLEDIDFFNFSVNAGKSAKLQMKQKINKKQHFISYYGGDFKMYDETNKN
jgi:hypothetical protein